MELQLRSDFKRCNDNKYKLRTVEKKIQMAANEMGDWEKRLAIKEEKVKSEKAFLGSTPGNKKEGLL